MKFLRVELANYAMSIELGLIPLPDQPHAIRHMLAIVTSGKLAATAM